MYNWVLPMKYNALLLINRSIFVHHFLESTPIGLCYHDKSGVAMGRLSVEGKTPEPRCKGSRPATLHWVDRVTGCGQVTLCTDAPK